MCAHAVLIICFLQATPRLSEDKVKQCVDPKLNNDYPPKAVAKVHLMTTRCVIGGWATGQMGNCCTGQNRLGWVMLTRNTFCPKAVRFSLEIIDVPNMITPVIMLQ